MAKRTFNWFPDTASEAADDPAVNVTKYGDGYEARNGESLNTNRQSWRLTFTRARITGEGLAIRQFLRDHEGVQAFIWKNPFEETGTYVARKWSTKSDQGIIVVTATFEEVFEAYE